MKINDPSLRSALAAEYVLGTMRGTARRRFEKLAATDSQLEEEVRRWEDRLIGLNANTLPVVPPEHVWTTIESRTAPGAGDTPQPARFGFWPSLAVSASALAILFALLWISPRFYQSELPTGYISVIRNQQSEPLWVVSMGADGVRLRVRSVASVPIEPGRSFELWLIPGGDGGPVSLGLLPRSGTAGSTLEERIQVRRAGALAVSLEPEGGSPTGAPTGPVLYQAPVLPL